MEKKSNNIVSLKDIFNYIQKRLQPGKRHSLEKQMQKDPFLEDAVEGLSMLDEEMAEKDIKELNKRIQGREKSSKKLWITGIAASIALIAITTITFIAIDNTRKSIEEMQLSREEIPDVLTDDSVPGYLSEEETSKESETTTKEKTAGKAQKPVVEKNVEATKQKSESVIDDFEFEEIIVDAEVAPEPEVSRFSSEQTEADEDISLIIVQEDSQDSKNIIRGRVVDADNLEGLPGASIVVKGKNIGTITDIDGYFEIEYEGEQDVELTAAFVGMRSINFTAEDIHDDSVLVMENEHLALEEVAVVGYGTKKRSKAGTDTDVTEFDFIAAEPANGYRKYKRYLKKNAVLPDTASVSKLTVYLSFDVNKQGNTENFEIIKSPSDYYSQKAKELIINGPSWKPATANDAVVVDRVTLEIQFSK